MSDRPRILLLIPTRTYRAEDFVRAARALDVEVTVASEERSSVQHLRPGALLTLDFAEPETAADDVEAFSAEFPIDAVVPVDDGSLLPAAVIAERLQLSHNPVEAVQRTRNKRRLRERLAEAGVRQPDWSAWPLDADPAVVSSRVSYPCVLKPVSLSASRGVLRADDEATFVRAFERIRRLCQRPEVAGELEERTLLVEDYVSGWEVAVEGLCREGKVEILALFDKPDPLVGPTFPETIYVTPSRLSESVRAEIKRQVQAAVRGLGLRDGPIHAELRGNESGCVLIELAARSIGGRCSRILRFGVGMSLEELIVRRAAGFPIPSTRREGRAVGVRMIQAHRAGIFREFRGLQAVASIPGILETDITVVEGDEVEPLPEGARYLAFIFARADTPARVEAALREAGERLEMVVETEKDGLLVSGCGSGCSRA